MKFFLALFLALPLSASNTSIKSLYNSLDPYSLTQYMAFYELYPDTNEGKEAINHAWRLLRGGNHTQHLPQFLLPKFDIQAVVSLVTRQPYDEPVKLTEEQLTAIEELCSHFTNRKLKGLKAWTKEEVLALPPEEIDLCRSLLIEQFEDSSNLRNDIRQYEASLDLMALQIFARLPEDATPLDKIREINRYIFQEMQFRFPPHSIYAQDIDLYTFLPSVLDSRQGVCLGVSILYLCLAQRLDLTLEIITPPGHIYVRYNDGETITNIETTARGINPPCETYLGLNTRKLQKRNIKAVIGLAFVNQASVYWTRSEHQKCVDLYEKALPYLDGDPLVNMFLGFNYLFVGRKKEGEALLKPLKDYIFDYAVAPETLTTDYLTGNIDAEGVKKMFLPVDETRESIKEKQQELKKLLKKHPKFRGGILQLAVTYLQLGRSGEAQKILERYHKIDPNDPTVEYYLSIVCAERRDFPNTWKYLKQAEEITQKRDHSPRALRSFRNKLRTHCPDPSQQ
ncbi:MAG: Beta-barrel assembly-enhancing protease [Chlamydiae bacterium]|nr:Beta-barrel assembly-enhancing protease [Chlamydiota bacterium]